MLCSFSLEKPNVEHSRDTMYKHNYYHYVNKFSSEPTLQNIKYTLTFFLRLTTALFLAHFLNLSRRDNNGWICTLIWISDRTLVTYFLCHLQMNNGSRASVPNDDFGAKPVWYHSPKKEKGRKWPLKMKIYSIFGWKYKLKFDTCLNWMAEFFSSKLYFTHIFSGERKEILIK